MTIYYIRKGQEGPIKIGYTAASAEKRMKQLQTGQPEKLFLLGTSPGEMADEQSIHKELKDYRLNGEWFDAKPELLAAIQAVIADQRSWFHFRIIRANSLIKDREELKELFRELKKEVDEKIEELDKRAKIINHNLQAAKAAPTKSITNSDGTLKMVPVDVLIREVTPLRAKNRELEQTVQKLQQQLAEKELQPVGTGVWAPIVQELAHPAASLSLSSSSAWNFNQAAYLRPLKQTPI